MTERRGGSGGRLGVRAVAATLVVGLATFGWAATGGGPTGCVHLCDQAWADYVFHGTIAPCVVTTDVEVLDGSVIQCEALPVHVTGGSLLGKPQARFRLEAASVWVSGAGHQISAACDASGPVGHGFAIETPGDIVVENGGRLTVSCALGGGDLSLLAGGAVTAGLGASPITANGTGAGLGASPITANGTGAGAPGGSVTIRADGPVTLRHAVEAKHSGTGGVANGGDVEIDSGADVAIRGGVVVTGTSSRGGTVDVSAEGAILVELEGTVDASASSAGDGGEVLLRANGPVTVRRPVKAKGIGAGATGGDVSFVGSAVEASHEITAAGGGGGGSVTLESRGGKVRIGTWITAALIDVTRTGTADGDAGRIDVRVAGSDVELGALADLDARGMSGGDGGVIELSGVGVTLDAAARVRTGGSGSGVGGEIRIQARGPVSLSGTVDAGVDGHHHVIHRLASPGLGGLVCPSATCVLTHAPTLPAPCGDEIRQEGVEECDGPDLGGLDCTTVGGGFSGGTLACTAACTFDTGGCTP